MLQPVTLKAFLTNAQPIKTWAAMGPQLFWGRDDGPYVPYDRSLKDQNKEVKVEEREWPYNWGDDIWSVLKWEGQPLFLHWSVDGCEALLGSPTLDVFQDFLIGVEEYARDVAGVHLVELPIMFWKGLD